MIDETTKNPKTLPSDAPPPKRGSGKPRKPPATPKPKRPKSGALWTNAAGEHYIRVSSHFYSELLNAMARLREIGFREDAALDAAAEMLDDFGSKLVVVVAGKAARALDSLKGGAGEGA